MDTYREALDGTRTMINRAYVVMVAVDRNGKSRPVPGLLAEGESAKAEWEAAQKRAELRKMRRKEGF